jgi:hypothetical protein
MGEIERRGKLNGIELNTHKYSTMLPVPPLTVKIPATLRMMSRINQFNERYDLG